MLLENLGEVESGTVGGVAAAGATTEVLKSLADLAVSSVSKIALTRTMLVASGVGLLIGGAIFCFVSSKLSEHADQAWEQMLENEKKIDRLCAYCTELTETAQRYSRSLMLLNELYQVRLEQMRNIVGSGCNWRSLPELDRWVIQNEVDIVSMLHDMCNVQIVGDHPNDPEAKVLNKQAIDNALDRAHVFLTNVNNITPALSAMGA